MNLGLIGIGLIGGSMALDLKSKAFVSRVYGYDISAINSKHAVDLGIVDELVDLDQLVEQCDIIIVATPIKATHQILPVLLECVDTNKVVLDVGSTKKGICDLVRHHRRRGRFVATHPMAGTENSGPKAAEKGLFDAKVAIVCDHRDSSPTALKMVRDMYACLGMDVIYMDSGPHDMHAAYVSHISHISSFVLSLAVQEKEKSEKTLLDMASGGFESTVRLAKSDATMWSQIFMQNQKCILEVLEVYEKHLKVFKNLIENNRESDLVSLIKRANKIKKALK